jgi:hypothetical protein
MNEIRLFGFELDSMGEYSTTLPTQTTLWKQWKRREPDGWYVGQYVPCPDPNRVGIRWSRVVLRHGPQSRDWQAPDWDRFETYRAELAAHRKGRAA